MLELARHPCIQEKLLEELMSVGDCRFISIEALDKLQYLEACIKEIMR